MEEKFDTFRIEYENIMSLCERTSLFAKNEIEKLFLEEDISLGFPLQSRVKEWNSIAEKITDGRFNLKKSVTELQDLIGLRIILLFKSDAEKVSEILKKNFTEIKTYNTAERLKNDQFGYTSIHIIAKVPTSWTNAPSSKQLDKIQFEIQIRTLSQHMWAEVSNVFQYKKKQSIPNELIRSIGRASALLEIVDFEFDRVLNERQKYNDEIRSPEKNNSQLLLNVDLLALTLDKLLPKINKDDNEDYSALLSDLKSSGINYINNLNALIEKNLPAAIEKDKKQVELELISNSNISIVDRKRIREKSVFYTHEGLIRIMLQIVDPTLKFTVEDE